MIPLDSLKQTTQQRLVETYNRRSDFIFKYKNMTDVKEILEDYLGEDSYNSLQNVLAVSSSTMRTKIVSTLVSQRNDYFVSSIAADNIELDMWYEKFEEEN